MFVSQLPVNIRTDVHFFCSLVNPWYVLEPNTRNGNLSARSDGSITKRSILTMIHVYHSGVTEEIMSYNRAV